MKETIILKTTNVETTIYEYQCFGFEVHSVQVVEYDKNIGSETVVSTDSNGNVRSNTIVKKQNVHYYVVSLSRDVDYQNKEELDTLFREYKVQKNIALFGDGSLVFPSQPKKMMTFYYLTVIFSILLVGLGLVFLPSYRKLKKAYDAKVDQYFTELNKIRAQAQERVNDILEEARKLSGFESSKLCIEIRKEESVDNNMKKKAPKEKTGVSMGKCAVIVIGFFMLFGVFISNIIMSSVNMPTRGDISYYEELISELEEEYSDYKEFDSDYYYSQIQPRIDEYNLYINEEKEEIAKYEVIRNVSIIGSIVTFIGMILAFALRKSKAYGLTVLLLSLIGSGLIVFAALRGIRTEDLIYYISSGSSALLFGIINIIFGVYLLITNSKPDTSMQA